MTNDHFWNASISTYSDPYFPQHAIAIPTKMITGGHEKQPVLHVAAVAARCGDIGGQFVSRKFLVMALARSSRGEDKSGFYPQTDAGFTK